MKTDEEILGLIEAAYRATSLKPVNNIWFSPDNNCACPLAAICVSQRKSVFGGYRDFYHEAAEILGKSVSWATGFTYGFDGYELGVLASELHPDHLDGHRLGRLARSRFLTQPREEK